MKTFSKIITYVIAAILFAWLLPWSYRFIAARPASTPFTLYSPIVKSFAYIETSKDAPTKHKDLNGNSYTATEFDSILPFFYYRQLLAKDNMPDSILGVPVTVGSIRKSNFSMKQTTRDVNVNAPKLWMMMESIPSHVDLEEPKSAFRMGKEITFINMSDNTIDTKKSELFNKVMIDKGFKFPMLSLNGNPTTRKDYDEGYIMVDAHNQVFHVKMVKGRPYVRKANIDSKIKITYAMITEFPDRKSLAFLGDADNNFYVLDSEYEIHQLPFAYNPRKNDIMIIGNMLDWTARVSDDKGYSLFAVDAHDFSLIDKYGHPYTDSSIVQDVASYIFPFSISFTSANDKWVKPRINDISCKAIILNLILAIAFILINLRNTRKELPFALSILIFGIFIFIPLLIIKK